MANSDVQTTITVKGFSSGFFFFVQNQNQKIKLARNQTKL